MIRLPEAVSGFEPTIPIKNQMLNTLPPHVKVQNDSSCAEWTHHRFCYYDIYPRDELLVADHGIHPRQQKQTIIIIITIQLVDSLTIININLCGRSRLSFPLSLTITII